MEPTQPQRGSRRKSSLAFPFRTETKRGGFIGFLEESGAAEIFLGLFSALFAEKKKPDDPVRWALEYLRQKAPERRLKLDLLLETLQHDILQTAYEIDEVKEQIRRNKGSAKVHLDHHHHHHDVGAQVEPDERWQMKPDPLFRPTLFPTSRLGTLSKGMKKRTTTEEFRRNTVEKELFPAEENEEGEEEEELREEAAVFKSTQTSPQQASEVGGSEDEEGEEEEMEGKEEPQPHGTKFTIYDPSFLDRHIPTGFWTQDFSIDRRQESEDEEEGSSDLVGVNYKFKILEETSWLPERDAVRLGLLRERSTPSGNEPKSPTSSGSFATSESTPSPPPPPPPTAIKEPKALDLTNYEWVRKTYGPILLRESKHAKI